MKVCIHESDGEYDQDCLECRKAWIQSALDAGIPRSVIEERSKLTDHFSKEYIEYQINPKGTERE